MSGGKNSKPIILLDLNYTFVENTREAHRLPAVYNVSAENYRQWMLPYLRTHNVVLITVRPAKFRVATLSHIAAQCEGWQPDMACFNEWLVAAPVSKERCLIRNVFPTYGLPEATRYLALESNASTREMYSQYGIPSQTWEQISAEPRPTELDG